MVELHLDEKYMKKEFKTVKLGFLAASMRMQARVCIRKHDARVCRLEPKSVLTQEHGNVRMKPSYVHKLRMQEDSRVCKPIAAYA